MSRVVPGCIPSPARTSASELNSTATASAMTITPRTRPAGIVRFFSRRGSKAQNW
jgi:hypothetical protein